MIESDFDLVRCSRPLTKRCTMSSNSYKNDGDFEFTFTVRINLVKLQRALAFAAILVLAMNANDTRTESMHALPHWIDKFREFVP